MRFQTPQFIDVEDKIFGPLTLKQFIYLAGGVGLSFILYRTLPLFIAILFIPIVSGIGAALAFYKYNNKPLIVAIENALYYFMKSKLYVWHKEEKSDKEKKELAEAEKAKKIVNAIVSAPKVTDSRLKELAWSLDIYDVESQRMKKKEINRL